MYSQNKKINHSIAAFIVAFSDIISLREYFFFKESDQQELMEIDKKLGVALVGLANYATEQLGPALLQTKHCYLSGIVTGSPDKVSSWKEKYNIPEKNIYSYENYDSIKDNPDIDIVYVTLPNHLHAMYSIRGLEASKHVICEKPMALSVAECDEMIAAAKKTNRFLSIGYRLHFDPYHLELKRLAKEKVYGTIKEIDTAFSMTLKKGEWRLDKEIAGGGPLMDLGIYCLQAVCYITGMAPVNVTAKTFPISHPEKFIGTEESVEWQMEMPDGLIADCRTSYSEDNNFINVTCENGWIELNPAFNYDNIVMKTSGLNLNANTITFPAIFQQAKQLDEIALSIKNNQPSKVPGEMGRRDMQIVAAIYEAMQTGDKIEVKY